jgi:hypothetical protein
MEFALTLLLAFFGLTNPTAATEKSAPEHPSSKPIVLSRMTTAPASPVVPRRISVNVACVTEDGAPIAGAEVTIYEIDSWTLDVRQKAIKLTNAGGICRFDDVAMPDADVTSLQTGHSDMVCNLAAQAAGRATATAALTQRNVIASMATIALVMHPAQKISGRVTAPNGGPLSGASVYFQPPSTFGRQPVAGICCVRTDKNGFYELTDLKAWAPPPDAGHSRMIGSNGRMSISTVIPDYLVVWVHHPEHGLKWAHCHHVPGTMDVRMNAAGVLSGRITDSTTGQPVAGASVWTESQPSSGQEADWTAKYCQNWSVTDQKGKYKLPVTAGNDFKIFVRKAGFFATGPSPRPKQIAANITTTVPDIPIARAATIRGRLIDAVSGKPIHFPSKPHVSVSFRSSVARAVLQPWSTDVSADGTFLRHALPSGRSYSLSVVSSDPAVKDKRDLGEVTVGAGETLEIEIPVDPLSRE